MTTTPRFQRLAPSLEDDLVRRLCHALDIARQAVRHLAPEGFIDENAPSLNIRPEKPIAETAVLLYAASLAPAYDEVRKRLRLVAEDLEPHARGARFQLGIGLRPALTWDYAIAHVLLTRLGFPDCAFDAIVRQALAAQAVGGYERTPHREAEQTWIASLWDDERPPCARTPSGRRTLLHQPMDIFGATDDSLYAFTHAVMYTTGFGLMPYALPRRRRTILAEAESILAACLDAQDYDLSAEILMTWPLTRASWSPMAAFAFKVLMDVEDQAGFLPTAGTRLHELDARSGADRTRYLLATSYHTAFVMGLLCAATLRSARAPEVGSRNQPPATGAVQSLTEFLQDASAPHWTLTFARLESSKQHMLAGMLFTMALHRCVRRSQMQRIPDILVRGDELGLSDMPAASQAAELLDRLRCVSQAQKPSPRVTPTIDARQPLSSAARVEPAGRSAGKLCIVHALG